jgi:hypothetical protein
MELNFVTVSITDDQCPKLLQSLESLTHALPRMIKVTRSVGCKTRSKLENLSGPPEPFNSMEVHSTLSFHLPHLIIVAAAPSRSSAATARSTLLKPQILEIPSIEYVSRRHLVLYTLRICGRCLGLRCLERFCIGWFRAHHWRL